MKPTYARVPPAVCAYLAVWNCDGDHLVLGDLFLLDAGGADAIGTLGLLVGQLLHHLIFGGAVEFLLEDGVGFDGLELGLEVGNVVGVLAAVGAATGVGEFVPIVLRLFAGCAPDEKADR